MEWGGSPKEFSLVQKVNTQGKLGYHFGEFTVPQAT